MKPRVSIGLPVYNGENYLAETLDSILQQTFSDFELIISDNASTDATQEICKSYLTRDQRIQYHRNEQNLGAAKNYNRTFELSSGKYFKWAAHDDLCAPEYLEKCIDGLDHNPEAIVYHPKVSIIDKHSNILKNVDDYLDFRSSKPNVRFKRYLFRPAGMWSAVFGLIRSSVLKRTSLIGNYLSSDKVLVGEFVLRGQIHQIPERLFFRRWHPLQSWRANPTKDSQAFWWNPKNDAKKMLPKDFKLLIEYMRMINSVKINSYEKLYCYLYILKWFCIKNKRTIGNYCQTRLYNIKIN